MFSSNRLRYYLSFLLKSQSVRLEAIAVFFIKSNRLFVSECHASCQSCSGGTNQDCDECKAGWEEDEQDACVGKTLAMLAVTAVTWSDHVFVQMYFVFASTTVSQSQGGSLGKP